MTDIHPSSVGRFVRSVAVLALPPEGQLKYLASVGLPEVVDELALEFDAGRLLVRQFEELEWVPAETGSRVGPLNDLLNQMSGPARAELWTAQALKDSPEWARVRLMARDVLFTI